MVLRVDLLELDSELAERHLVNLPRHGVLDYSLLAENLDPTAFQMSLEVASGFCFESLARRRKSFPPVTVSDLIECRT